MRSFLILTCLAFGSYATAAGPVDPAVAAAWGWTAASPPVAVSATKCPKGQCENCKCAEKDKCPGGCLVQVAASCRAAPGTTYAEVYARVKAGEWLTWEGAPPGMPHGTYDCWMIEGSPRLQRRVVSQPAAHFPVVGASSTTPTTGVIVAGMSPPLALAPGSFAGSPQTGIFTGVPNVGISGSTDNCPPAG